jgi:nucleotide-binding universal stress UspA family protein
LLFDEGVDMFQQILCATDFSDTAEAAWEIACELARLHRAELVLVHALVELPLYATAEAPGPAVAQIWEDQQRWVQTALDERVAAAGARGLKARALVKTGPAAASIADAAAEEGTDLIVIGTHGRTGFNRLVIGSVAERVVRIAPCPVLTVKPRTTGRQTRATA